MRQMSLDRDGSKLLENCLKMKGSNKHAKFNQQLLDILVTFLNIPLNPNENDILYEDKFFTFSERDEYLEKNNREIYFSDILVSKFGNYVI